MACRECKQGRRRSSVKAVVCWYRQQLPGSAAPGARYGVDVDPGSGAQELGRGEVGGPGWAPPIGECRAGKDTCTCPQVCCAPLPPNRAGLTAHTRVMPGLAARSSASLLALTSESSQGLQSPPGGGASPPGERWWRVAQLRRPRHLEPGTPPHTAPLGAAPGRPGAPPKSAVG